MKNLIFSSVGDNTNFDNIWLDKDRKYDVFVIYYGDEEKNFKKYSKKVDYIEKRKGDKWQNFHYLYNTQYDKIQEYDRIFFLDDDIIISDLAEFKVLLQSSIKVLYNSQNSRIFISSDIIYNIIFHMNHLQNIISLVIIIIL